jgi:hypothetical protein
MIGSIKWKDHRPAWPRQKMRSYLKKNRAKRATVWLKQLSACLASLKPCTAKTGRKKKKEVPSAAQRGCTQLHTNEYPPLLL